MRSEPSPSSWEHGQPGSGAKFGVVGKGVGGRASQGLRQIFGGSLQEGNVSSRAANTTPVSADLGRNI